MRTIHNLSNLSFHIFYCSFAQASVCYFVNKTLNPSSYSATLLTPTYSHLHLRSSVEGARNVMIHNVYHTGNLSPTSSENQPLDQPLFVDTHETFLHVSAALSDASAYHVLLCNFNINHPIWEGAGVRPSCFSQQLLSL
jgi:hypothetical protein